MKQINLNFLRKTQLLNIYSNLITDEILSDNQITTLLKLAIIFINQGTEPVVKFGYKIILAYSNKYKNYQPLYDIAINNGYIPIAKTIEHNHKEKFENNFLNAFQSAFIENFKNDNIYFTEQQKEMNDIFNSQILNTSAFVAPTSYGKSMLLIDLISKINNKPVCIIVPTKALLAQTKKRILKNKLKRKIITHPDMYIKSDKNFIAILTQERLLRLLEKNKTLYFDFVFVDEAHNLLDNDYRNRLLAITLAILKKRNTSSAFKFLTPFLIDTSNLKISLAEYNISEYKITESLKIDKFFCYNFKKEKQLKIYDQFLNTFISQHKQTFTEDIDLIIKKQGTKNIVYFNKPPDIENFAKKLTPHTSKTLSKKITKVCNEISEYLHKDYNLITCLKKGVVYHHGSVPDIIKLYIEKLFTDESEIKFIITSSTLLEGVNIPAEKLFMLDYKKGRKKMTPSQFKNLIGRVCRFGEIFNITKNNLILLEPEIYVIASDYIADNANIEKFLQDNVKEGKKIKDDVQNVMLKNTKITNKNAKEKREEEEFLINIEPNILKTNEHRNATTTVGKSCFVNNINEINILESEVILQNNIDTITKNQEKAKSAEDVIQLISLIFIKHIKDDEKNKNIKRLLHESTQKFYAMFLEWKMRNAPYSELIGRFLAYWNGKIKNNIDTYVYVGKWGDKQREGFRSLWIDLKEKKSTELTNLAIVRIKEEQDFLENQLMKFIEILNDLELIEENIYKKIKYGTHNDNQILMIKNGFSPYLTNIILNNYSPYITLDKKNNTIDINEDILEAMKKNKENDILIFETQLNI